MTKVADDTVFCTRHGWVLAKEEAEIVPGIFMPVCHLCGEV
jgi:hypothetical protein